MQPKTILRNLKKILKNALSKGDDRLALQVQIAISKHLPKNLEINSNKKESMMNIDNLTKEDLIHLIHDISKKIQKINLQ